MTTPQPTGLSIDVPEDNYLELGDIKATNSSIRVQGKHNRVVIEPGATLTDLRIIIESDSNEVYIGRDARVCGSIIQKLSSQNRVLIGEATSVGHANFICGESSTIAIGADCMISWGVEIRTTDSHAIFDIDSGQRINPGASISIGNHVWIGAKAVLTKGTTIPDGSVVGIASLVNKPFDEPNVVIAGVPARIVRRHVRWERPLLG